jgi:hypothetical protein
MALRALVRRFPATRRNRSRGVSFSGARRFTSLVGGVSVVGGVTSLGSVSVVGWVTSLGWVAMIGSFLIAPNWLVWYDRLPINCKGLHHVFARNSELFCSVFIADLGFPYGLPYRTALDILA